MKRVLHIWNKLHYQYSAIMLIEICIKYKKEKKNILLTIQANFRVTLLKNRQKWDIRTTKHLYDGTSTFPKVKQVTVNIFQIQNKKICTYMYKQKANHQNILKCEK